MIRTCSSPAHRVDRGTVKILQLTVGRCDWHRRSWDRMRLFFRESQIARVVLTIIVALVTLAALQMLGVFDFAAGWSVLRNVSGWVGPAAAVGAAGAAAAAAGARGGHPDVGVPDDPNWDGRLSGWGGYGPASGGGSAGGVAGGYVAGSPEDHREFWGHYVGEQNPPGGARGVINN
jgi:hypothetical protein